MEAPIFSFGEIRGVLGVCALERGRFDESDLRLIEAFANLASIALRNAEAYEESTRQAQVERGFYRIAAVLGEPLSASATLDAVAQAAAESLGGDSAAVLRGAGGELELAGDYGLPARSRLGLRDGATRSSPPRASGQAARVPRPPPTPVSATGAARRRRQAAARCSPSRSRSPAARGRGSCSSSSLRSACSRTSSSSSPATSPARRAARSSGASCTSSSGARARWRSGWPRRAGARERARSGQRARGGRARTRPRSSRRHGASVPRLRGRRARRASRVRNGRRRTHSSTRSASTAWLVGDIVQSRTPKAIANAATTRALARRSDACRRLCGIPRRPDDRPGRCRCRESSPPTTGVRARGARRRRDAHALAANAAAARTNAELYQGVAPRAAAQRRDSRQRRRRDRGRRSRRKGRALESCRRARSRAFRRRMPSAARRRRCSAARWRPVGGASRGGSRLVAVRRGGEEVWLSVSEAVMTDPAGGVAGRIFAFRDISAERASSR